MNTTTNERNWTEDFAHDNGNYLHTCRSCQEAFLGHKRRSVCKICDRLEPPSKLDQAINEVYSDLDREEIRNRVAPPHDRLCPACGFDSESLKLDSNSPNVLVKRGFYYELCGAAGEREELRRINYNLRHALELLLNGDGMTTEMGAAAIAKRVLAGGEF